MFGSLPSWLLEYIPYGKWTSEQLWKIQRYARSTYSFYRQLNGMDLLVYFASFVLLSDYRFMHPFPSIYSIFQSKRYITAEIHCLQRYSKGISQTLSVLKIRLRVSSITLIDMKNYKTHSFGRDSNYEKNVYPCRVR